MNEMETAAYIIELVPYLARTIAAEARQTLGDGWFTLVHLRVLAHIRRSGGCSLGELAERRSVSLPTMSKMVSSLVEKGLITREPDPTNRRAVIIRLTDAGDKLYLDVLAKLQQDIARDLSRLTPQQRASIVDGLETLASVLSPLGEVRQYLHLPRGEPESATQPS
ncbi:MAG: MarR family transcriptional regulator [Chloroflexota bacterium]|nr:MarR family transcriptional regulator [Chloroflexota bacterium]